MKSIERGGNKTALSKHDHDLYVVARSQDGVAYWAVRFATYRDADEYWEKFL